MPDRPRTLIEGWLPVQELGIESRRERAAASALPPLYFLHVWWARRPLVASRAAVLGSLLPAWSPALRERYRDSEDLASESSYRKWFLRMCGILGDPVAASRAIAKANERDEQVAGGYGYPQAYKNRLSADDLALLHEVLEHTWGGPPAVLDPTAGGGSIPYEAMRLGLPTYANDLNPIAAVILTAGLALPGKFGPELTGDLKRFGSELAQRIEQRLTPYYPLASKSERVLAYLSVRTVTCPRTGKAVPLAPSWWLSQGANPAAVRLRTRMDGHDLDAPEYEVVRGTGIDFDPSIGTVARGDAISPWDGLAIDSKYIREQARLGRMHSDLYAVVTKDAHGRGFRAPSREDHLALEAAKIELGKRWHAWVGDVLPDEPVPRQHPKWDVSRWGLTAWTDMFSPRQLLAHGVFIEEYRSVADEVRSTLPDDRASAVLLLLGQMQGKSLNWNSYLSSWDVSRQKIRSVFDQHNLTLKLTFAEFDAARALYPWALDQLTDAYGGIATLMQPADVGAFTNTTTVRAPGPVTVTARSAADLSGLDAGSIAAVVIDPPYYDNVMYAQLSDYFYVWEKRTIGQIEPSLFEADLTDKRNEAIANITRFEDAGKRAAELANADYRAKMGAIFAECSRVLRDNGVLTVMFTHKRAEAWDTLGMALLEAGFRIETSWPVNTESEQSLHQANKNAAASTIFLVCRKRAVSSGQPPFFEDLEGDVRAAVREAVDRFSSAGLAGVDLLLSTYGPALSVISSRWPVYSSDADPLTGRSRLLRPEEALDAARSEVVRMQRRRLVGIDLQFDAYTDFALIAWETFKAAEFPFDEARRLALATGGLDIDDLNRARLLEKKTGTVVLLPPERRLRRPGDDELPGVRPDALFFPFVVDAVHTVMYVAETDGMPAARALIDRAGLASDQRFLGCLQGLVNAIPRTRTKTGWARNEAGTLDRICAAYFPDIVMPRAQETVENLGLWT